MWDRYRKSRPKLSTLLGLVSVTACIGSAMPANASATLPNGWVLEPPPVFVVRTGTMPQGMAVSPDGSTVAVVESGYNPAAVSLYNLPDLKRTATIPLPGAFGRPLWTDRRHLVVAGANSDAVLLIDIATRSVQSFPLGKGSNPLFVARAPDSRTYAVATAGDDSVRSGPLARIARARRVPIGGFPGGLAFGVDGRTIYVAVRSTSTLLAVDTASSRVVARRATRLHPSALLVTGSKVYLAESDADSVAVYSAGALRLLKRIFVGDAAANAIGVSPNAISQSGNTIFVTLAAANSVAVIRDDSLMRRTAAGWYPTDAVAAGKSLYVLDGKGEGTRPNPGLRIARFHDYIAAIEFGSLRRYPLPAPLAELRASRAAGTSAIGGSPQGMPAWDEPDASPVVCAHGPIRHVFFVLKENRSYDQVLGDMPQGNGDAALAWFGRDVTPNEHALASRFGLFDNAYASGETSAPGHMWADAAFANDYFERSWPALYGERSEDDLSHGDGAVYSYAGYLWQAARRAGVSFRDYGELVDPGKTPAQPWVADVPSLIGLIDPRYAGWDLRYSDIDRVKEWKREFDAFVRAGTLPQFEFIWLPGDHTYGSKAGEFTPASYVATNDVAFGKIVQAISHSRVWGSSVIFATEDDAQDGPDHVSDQRTTTFVISPYARGGVLHEHVSTVSLLRTIEALLSMKPLSAYDAMAVPMRYAFKATPDLAPYDAQAPRIDVRRRNTKLAYGAEESARLDFSRPDAIAAGTLNRILARNHS